MKFNERKGGIEMPNCGILADVARVVFSMTLFTGLLVGTWMLALQGIAS